MTAHFLKAADLAANGALELFASLDPLGTVAPPHYIWLEAADGWALDHWRGLERGVRWCGAGRDPVDERTSACLPRSTAGRLFAPDGELRWRVVPALGASCWRTVFLGKTDWVGASLEDHSDVLKDLSPSRERFFLWGRQTGETPGEWIELRIPHRFRYPVADGCGNVQVEVEQWCDEVGEPHFLRLCDLVPEEEQSDA